MRIGGCYRNCGWDFHKVEAFVPLVELWRSCSGLVVGLDATQVFRYKRPLADAALDGSIPEGSLPSRDEL